MAFIGNVQDTQYTASIGPLPKTGEPMAASLVKGAAAGALVAVLINPPLGLLTAVGVAAVSRKKKGAAAGGW